MQCPTCGKHLDTRAGMRQHHAKVHDESLPNRVCKGCDSEFYDPKAQRVFCDECNPNAGSNNGNWKDAKETAVCRICGEPFEYYPSDKKGVYCPECVANAEGLLPENYAEPIERIETHCANCGTSMEVLPSRVKRRRRGVFCDMDCYGEWLSEHIVGANHHQWQDAERTYTGTWWEVRRRALDRDDHRCQHCGADRSDLGQEPDVHHIVPIREFDDPKNAHTVSNVVSLCRSCHRNVESGNEPVPGPRPRE